MPGNDILGDLKVFITGENAKLVKTLKDSEKQTENSGKKIDSTLKKLSNSFGNVGKKLTTFVTLPIIALGAAALKSVGDFQLYQASFETMLGSAETAKGLMEDLQELAASTPFTFDDLAQSSKTLLQFGVDLEDTLPSVRQIGDIAQGSSERFKSLSLAFGQVQSAGRLMGQDLLQMINAGFNPLQIISQKTGETMAELKDRMSSGSVSAREVADAFRIATSEGGPFFEGMERASKTLPGLISTLQDNVAAMGREFAQELVPIVTDVVKGLTKLAQEFSQLDEEQKKTILTIAGVAAAIGPVLTIGGKLIGLLNTLKAGFLALGAAGGPIALVAAAIAGVVTAFALLDDAISKSQYEQLEQEFGSLREELELTNSEFRGVVQELERISSNRSAENLREIFRDIAERNNVTQNDLLTIIDSTDRLGDLWGDVLDPIRNISDEAELFRQRQAAAEARAEHRQQQEQAIADEMARQAEEAQRIRDLIDQENSLIQDFATAWRGLTALQSAGFRDEQQFLEDAIALRNEEISRLEERSVLEGHLNEQDRNRLQLLYDANEDSKIQLEEIIEQKKEEAELSIEQLALEAKQSQALQRTKDELRNNKKEAEEVLTVYQEWARTLEEDLAGAALGAARSGFQELGKAIANGEDLGRSFQKSIIQGLSKILDSLANQLYALAAINYASLNIPGGIAATAGAIAADIAAGIAAAEAAKLAQGGITGINSPVNAIIGDNTQYKEIVAPLSPQVYSEIANGIVSAMARNSNAAGSFQNGNISPGTSTGLLTKSGDQNININISNLLSLSNEDGLQEAARAIYPFIKQEGARRGD